MLNSFQHLFLVKSIFNFSKNNYGVPFDYKGQAFRCKFCRLLQKLSTAILNACILNNVYEDNFNLEQSVSPKVRGAEWPVRCRLFCLEAAHNLAQICTASLPCFFFVKEKEVIKCLSGNFTILKNTCFCL